MGKSTLSLISALIAASTMSCGLETRDADTKDTDTTNTVGSELTGPQRCALDSLNPAQAIQRIEWARKCGLTLNTAGSNSTFTSERGAIVSGGTLVGAPDYLENTTTRAYTGNINNFEINFSYGFSRYTGSIYTVFRDTSGPTLNFFRWWQPSTRQRVKPLYPVFDNTGPTISGVPVFPPAALLNTTSPTNWQTVGCDFFTKDAAGALTPWTGNHFVGVYCEAVCNPLNGTFNSTNVPLSIPDANLTGVTSTLAVTGAGNVGTVKLSLNISHTFISDLVVTLIAPDGTQFLVPFSDNLSANLVITDQTITALYGRIAAGTWRLKVQDLAAADVGTINSWSLNIAGNCNPVVPWSGSATPNVATVDNGTVCSSVNVAARGGDPSLARLSISGSHDFCSVLSGTLTHNGVTVPAFPIDVFPFGDCTFSLSNVVVTGLAGDTVGTWTLCITDNDAFGDTGVLNSWSVRN